MNAIRRVFGLLQEGIFVGAIILLVFSIHSPVPWFSTSHNMMSFTPYVPPEGYTPPNNCPTPDGSSPTVPSNLANVTAVSTDKIPRLRFARSLSDAETMSTVPMVKRADAETQSLIAIWIGPFGSCSRDADGRVWCTKPSLSHPQFNLTHLTPNHVYYPSAMKKVIKTKLYMALLVLHCIFFGLFLLISLPWYFSSLLAAREAFFGLGGAVMGLQAFTAFALFITTFFLDITGLGSYNSIDNFYQAAKCGTPRPVISGVLLRANRGDGYKIAWAAWCMTFVVGLGMTAIRFGWLDSNAAKDGERAAKNRAQQKQKEKEEREARKAREKEEKATNEKKKSDEETICTSPTMSVLSEPTKIEA